MKKVKLPFVSHIKYGSTSRISKFYVIMNLTRSYDNLKIFQYIFNENYRILAKLKRLVKKQIRKLYKGDWVGKNSLS